jgi:hypothetical protein
MAAEEVMDVEGNSVRPIINSRLVEKFRGRIVTLVGLLKEKNPVKALQLQL